MSTLGQKPATQHVSTEKQTITGNGGTSYTLQQSVSQASDIEVFVNNTRQEPTVAYTANNTTLTMTGAVNASDSFYVIFQGKAIQTAGLPVDAAITASTITTSQTITSTGNVTTSGTLNTPSINGGQIGGRRNIIINGAMLVAQRGTSFNYTTTDAYSLDRFRIDVTGGDNSAGAFTLTQADVTDLPGFTKAMKFDVTTADTSIAAGEALNLSYRIEGQDLQQLKKGTSEAEKFTISFYVKGTAKTYALEVLDIDTGGNRSIAKTFNVTTSWNRVILTFDGDTTGPLDNDANRSLDLNFFFHAGSTYTGGTLQTSWGAMTNNERAAGIGSLYSSTDNELFITGLQMEVGSVATAFEHRSFAEEQQLCFRYCRKFTTLNFGRARDGDSFYGGAVHFSPPMRATPTLSDATYTNNTGNVGTPGINSGQGPSADSIQLYNSGSSWTANSFPKLTGIFAAEL